MADTPAQEAAAGLLEELAQFTEDESVETNEAPVEGEQPQEEVEETGLPEINWEVPEELQELLETPDFEEDEDDEEPLAPAAEFEVDEYADPETAKLAKRLAKAEKQLQWEKQQKIKASQKLWQAEAAKYFQFSAPSTIQANSRRAFLKEAQRQHEAVAKVAKPIFDQLAAEKAKLKEQAIAEARAEAAEMWGRPTTGPTGAQIIQENTQTVKRARIESSRGLTGVLKEKLLKGDINL